MRENEQNQQEFSTQKKPPRVRVGMIFFGAVVAGVVAVVGCSFLIAFQPGNTVSVALRRVLPFPVAIVDGAFISYGELDKDRESIRRFYESQSDGLAKNGLRVDFDTPDGQKRLLIREKDILNKLIEDRIIVSLAREKNIRFSESDVIAKMNEEIQKGGGSEKDLKDQLSRLYGWSLSEFQDKIILPSLYRDALEASFAKERDTSKAKATIEKAASARKTRVSFEEVVAQFSDGDSKKNSGNLGWIDIATLVPELQNSARTQSIDVVGPIVESSIGYHILVVSDRKTEPGKELANLRQIFVQKPAFPDWLAEKKHERMVLLLPRRYVWDKESGNVIFRDADMRNFEQHALEHPEGDPSLMF